MNTPTQCFRFTTPFSIPRRTLNTFSTMNIQSLRSLWDDSVVKRRRGCFETWDNSTQCAICTSDCVPEVLFCKIVYLSISSLLCKGCFWGFVSSNHFLSVKQNIIELDSWNHSIALCMCIMDHGGVEVYVTPSYCFSWLEISFARNANSFFKVWSWSTQLEWSRP